MGSSYFGGPSLGNGRSGSSRKGKKSNSDKPKQPQRGLGVAQLEKIRLSNEMGCCYQPSLPSHDNFHKEDVTVEKAFSSPPSSSSSYSSPSVFSFHSNSMMGLGDMETTNIRFGELQSGGTARTEWNYNRSISPPQQAAQSSVTRQFLTPPFYSSSQQRRNDGCGSMGSSSQNSDSSDAKELDLDLKLSL
ncbi:hypothetical protein AAC387_Pa02g2592 [Persea americana]